MIFLLSLLIFIFDQLTKTIILRIINPGESFPIISNIFHITLVFNPGAAFGIFAHAPFLFMAVSIFLIIFLIAFIVISSIRRLPSHIPYLVPTIRRGRVYTLPLSVILGGALGNLADRLRFGFVIDFLDFRIWPVFNIADIAITIGAILLLRHTFKDRQKA